MARPAVIVCLGDSLTAAPDAWPTLLDVPLVNVAVVGSTFADLMSQLDRAPTSGTAAVATIGTNDVARWAEPVRPDLLVNRR